jgi:hypothetical protein
MMRTAPLSALSRLNPNLIEGAFNLDPIEGLLTKQQLEGS